MTMRPSLFRLVLIPLLAGALFTGCSSLQNHGGSTSLRPTESSPANAELGAPLVVDWRAACQALAQDLVMASVFQHAQRPQVLEISPAENRTGVPIDSTIYALTIREKINQSGNPNIVFRQHTARSRITEERAHQSGTPLLVEQGTSIRRGRRQPVGPPADGMVFGDNEVLDTLDGRRTVPVSSQLADVDYFLEGVVYAQNEVHAGARDSGHRYFHFQFNLYDARTGLIVWEKAYTQTRAGALAPARVLP